MAVSVLWTILIFVIIFYRIKKVVRTSQSSGSKGRNTPVRPAATRSNPVRPAATRNNPVRPQQRSFAAMPQQERAVPNVERDCRADDKHHSENNLFRYNIRKATAIPNVQRTYTRQPKKSGNRKTARQLYMGDMVPQGMRVIECGYCAADNLVPFASREGYKCYFCHYDI